MRQDLTDITMVVDRSGSMCSIAKDAAGGINELIKDQATQEGEAMLTLAQFDNEYELIHNGVPAADVPEYVLTPRWSTALLDAVGKTINTTGERLAAMSEEDRPATVLFVIVTDGHENASTEFNKTQIKEMIEKQQEDFNWQFSFLGADAAAFDEAGSLGISRMSTSVYDPKNVGSAYAATSKAMSRVRSAAHVGEVATMSFTNKEREAMS